MEEIHSDQLQEIINLMRANQVLFTSQMMDIKKLLGDIQNDMHVLQRNSKK